LRVLEVSLKKAGFNVVTASTGSAALGKAKGAEPDLVISDTDLPEMDGYDFCREFKSRPGWGEIPFIFLTSQTSIENKIRGLELGVDDYLTKPIYIKEILTRVRILLQKRDRANFEQKKDSNTRFAGRLSDMGVVDLIQTIEVSRKTGLIHFKTDQDRTATIFFKEGRVIDAEAGHLQGEDAVYRLLTWNDGDFEALFRSVRRKPVIEMSSQALLMEGMRRLDEWGRMQEQLPDLDQQFEVVYDELWDRLSELPDEVNQILRLFDSQRTLEQVIDGANIGDLEAVEIISKLYFEGIIIEAANAMGSGSFSLEKLKIKHAAANLPSDLEDTVPDSVAPTSEELGEVVGENTDDESSDGAEVDEDHDSDSDDLARAAEVAVASAKRPAAAAASGHKVRTATSSSPSAKTVSLELSGMLDKAIGEATPVNSSERESKDPKRTTAKGIPVAKLALKSKSKSKSKSKTSTLEERLEEEFPRSKSGPKAEKKKGSTQPFPAVVPAATETLPDDGSPENFETANAEAESTAVPENFETANAEAESTAVPEDVDSSTESGSPAAENDEEPTDTGDDPVRTIEVDADYADDDADGPPERSFEEAKEASGVVSSGVAKRGTVSGALASKVILTKSGLAGEAASKAKADAEALEDATDTEELEEPAARSVPSISHHDVDEDGDEPGGFSPWILVGTVAAAAIALMVWRSIGGEGASKEEKLQSGVVAQGTDAQAAIPTHATPLSPVAPDASVVAVVPVVPDASVVAVVSDASVPPATLPKETPNAVPSTEDTLKTLIASARRAKRKGDKLEALQLLDEALEIRKSTSALLLKAETLLALGDSRSALAVATELTTVAPRRAQGWRVRGLTAYEQKDYTQARTAFGRYLELRPNAPDAADVRGLLESL